MEDVILPITFPLCLVRRAGTPEAAGPFLCDQFGWLLAFLIREDAMAYIRATPGATLRWITQREAVMLLADLHERGTPGVRLNPGVNPNSGRFLLLNEFARAVGAELPTWQEAV
jgi:hypothetical protein